ncbi:hypothetical protein ACJJTC_013355 [Scirpophaga incertulas]
MRLSPLHSAVRFGLSSELPQLSARHWARHRAGAPATCKESALSWCARSNECRRAALSRSGPAALGTERVPRLPARSRRSPGARAAASAGARRCPARARLQLGTERVPRLPARSRRSPGARAAASAGARRCPRSGPAAARYRAGAPATCKESALSWCARSSECRRAALSRSGPAALGTERVPRLPARSRRSPGARAAASAGARRCPARARLQLGTERVPRLPARSRRSPGARAAASAGARRCPARARLR